MIRKYHPIWINTHFNHPYELTKEAVEACARLADAGCPWATRPCSCGGSTTAPTSKRRWCTGWCKARVRPYYIYQCDLSEGIEHFRTPVSKGIEIIEHLRGHTSGYAVPTFVVDTPGGGGKMPVGPNYIVSQSPGKIVLRNYEGEDRAPTPNRTTATPTIPKSAASAGRPRASVEGVAALMSERQDGARPDPGHVPRRPAAGDRAAGAAPR